MSNTKKFFELVSKDKDVKIELGEASLKALIALMAEKGLKDDTKKTLDEVTAKVAEKHGFNFKVVEKLDDDELDAAAGGAWGCDECINISTMNY